MRSRAAKQAWLSVTPEPERELPATLATLRAGGPPGAGDVARERDRIERLVLRGHQRDWLAYVGEVIDLIEQAPPSGDAAVAEARAVALDVMRNHHALLLGLPGDSAARTSADRARLDAARIQPTIPTGER